MPNRPSRLRLLLCALAAAWMFSAASPAVAQAPQEGANPRSNFELAQRWLLNRFRTTPQRAGKYERRNASVVAAFRDVVADPSKSTVEILADYDAVALGAVVTANGHILTKASDLKGKLICKLHDNRRLEAELLGVNKEHDLALLKISADGLTPVVWTDQSEIPVGSWLATPGVNSEAVSIGVLSAAPRLIPAPRPILGVLLAQVEEGARIDEVLPGSGAALAELKVGDVILGVNDEEIASRESLIRRIGQFQPGDTVKLMVLRGEEHLKIDATLGPLGEEGGEINRHEFQNKLGGELSRRRAGFPSVFQHDSVLQPNQCGGPVVDLNGHVVGINIARAGRVASYAIPAPVAKEVLVSLLDVKPVSLDERQKTN